MVPTEAEFDEIRSFRDRLNRFLPFFQTKMVKNTRSGVEIRGFHQSFMQQTLFNSPLFYVYRSYSKPNTIVICPSIPNHNVQIQRLARTKSQGLYQDKHAFVYPEPQQHVSPVCEFSRLALLL